MSLTQIEHTFLARCQELKSQVDQTSTCDRLAGNGRLETQAKRYRVALDCFNATKEQVLEDVRSWKASQVTPLTILEQAPQDPLELKQRYQLIKTCIKVLYVAAICGVLPSMACMLPLFALVIALAITPAQLVVMPVIPIIPIVCLVATVAFCTIILGFNFLILPHIELSRKIDLYTSENFKDFLKNVAEITEDESQWHHPELDLLNPKLHEAYREYREAVLYLPRQQF